MAHSAHTVILAYDVNKVTPGLLGFLIVLALGIATWFLLRSLNRHLGRIQVPRPDGGSADAGIPVARGDAGTAASEAADSAEKSEPEAKPAP